jgi:hypothetical protein
MLLGGYEAAGFYGPDVEKQIAMSAPRYTYSGGQPQVGL